MKIEEKIKNIIDQVKFTPFDSLEFCLELNKIKSLQGFCSDMELNKFIYDSVTMNVGLKPSCDLGKNLVKISLS